VGGDPPYAIGYLLDGDFNLDGRVNAADYTVWRNRGGNLVDCQLWKTSFGRTLSGSGAASVPEPASSAMSFFAVLVAFSTARVRATVQAIQPVP
jgi:hypothetical protein